MAPQKKLITQVRELLYKKGQEALEMARQSILQETVPSKPLQEAMRFFILDWEDVLHPALLSLACEAIGGKPNTTTQVGAALVLLAGGADVHDDVIDQSTTKDSKPTVFGKFGKDISILVGDALLFKGLYLLHEACEALPKKQKQSILDLTKQAFFGISSAEAEETYLRGRADPNVAKEYLEMIRTKAAVSEATMKIGAVLGGGTSEEVDILGHFGKTFGILFTVRDEFADIFELAELKNRAKKECLPLPILFLFENPRKANKIGRIFEGQITEREVEDIVNMVTDSKETAELKKKMRAITREENQRLRSVEFQRNALGLLMRSMMEDL